MTKHAHLTLNTLDLAYPVLNFKNNAEALDRLANLVDLKNTINNECRGIKVKSLELQFNAETVALAPLFNVSTDQLAIVVSGFHDNLGAYIEKRIKPYLHTVIMQKCVSYMLNDNDANTRFQHGILIMDTLGENISLATPNRRNAANLNNLEFSLVANYLGLSLMLEDIHSFNEEKTLNSLFCLSREDVEPMLDLITDLVDHQFNAVYNLAYGIELEGEAKAQYKLHINCANILAILD